MADSPASSVQSHGDSPPEVSTTETVEDREGSPGRQDSLCQRRPCKSRQQRHRPYESRSPSSVGTSSDDDGEYEIDSVVVEHKRLKRIAANSRERKRMHTVNGAFDQLRELVPTYPSNRKLSKIDTLRLACSYIEDLTSLLRNPAVVHGDDVQLFHQTQEGFMHSSGFGLPSSYPGVQVKSEYGDYATCNYQHYRVQPSYFASASDCASSDYSPSEAELSPPFLSPGIGVRPPAFTRTASDSAVALHMAQARINGPAYSTRHISQPNCSPLATIQHMSSPTGHLPPPPHSVSPPVWQRTGSVPLYGCVYGQ